MSMAHPKLIQREKDIREIFYKIDEYLEEKYAGIFPLRPNRPETGATACPEMDGLFNVGAVFTPGFGSNYGRGYIVQIDLATFSQVEPELRQNIEAEVKAMLEKGLEQKFPGRELKVEKDGTCLKIFGDLSLGEN